MSRSPTVRRFASGDLEEWNALVARSRSCHFLFARGYMSYHSDRFEDFSLVIASESKLLAALPATIDANVVVSHGGLTFGGLVADEALTARRTVETFARVLEMLDAHGIRKLVYKPVPHIYHRIPGEEDLYALFVNNARLVGRDISSTVRPSLAPVPSKGRRSAIRQAQRIGVTVATSDRFVEFMEIETQALRDRHGVDPVHTGQELELLAHRFPDNISLVAAFRDQRMLAGVVVYETPVVAHAQYVGASPEGYELHALDLIINHLITDRYRDKRYFDFGISTTEAGRRLNEGLIRNKESFGGRATVYDTYEIVIGD